MLSKPSLLRTVVLLLLCFAASGCRRGFLGVPHEKWNLQGEGLKEEDEDFKQPLRRSDNVGNPLGVSSRSRDIERRLGYE